MTIEELIDVRIYNLVQRCIGRGLRYVELRPVDRHYLFFSLLE